MKSLTRKIRSTSFCLITAIAIAAPGISHAGLFDRPIFNKVANKIETIPSRVQNKVQEGAGQKVSDLIQKVNSIYSQFSDNRPLLENMKKIRFMDNVKDVVVFIADMQADYQTFANQKVFTTRSDIKNVLTGFSDLGYSVLGTTRAHEISVKIQKAAELVDLLPVQFVYLLDKAIGQGLVELRDRLQGIRDNLAMLPYMPSMQELYQNPMAYMDNLCQINNARAVRVNIAILQARLKAAAFVIETIKGYLPNDLTVNANVVAGGGATVSKHPAQYPLQIMLTIVKTIELKITNTVAIANSACIE